MASPGSPILPYTFSLMASIKVREWSERLWPGLSGGSSVLLALLFAVHLSFSSLAGVATPLTPPVVYGVVDLYGMAVKVTIVHNNNHSDRLRRNNAILRALSPEGALRRAAPAAQAEPERLLFHPNCGQKAAITHEGRTALRPQYGPWGGEAAEGAVMGLKGQDGDQGGRGSP